MNLFPVKKTLLAAALCALALAGAASAADVTYQPSGIHAQAAGGAEYLFLPAESDLHALAFSFPKGAAVISGSGGSMTVKNGQPFDLTDLAQPADGVYSISVNGEPLRVMRGDGIASLYLTSADPAKGREWVESAKDKSNKAKGSVLLIGPDGSVVYDGALKQIKGRGNSTWLYSKRPYQIKLDTACDLIETGLDGEASKTWVLLAGYDDPTLLRNAFTFAASNALGLPYTPHFRQVNLYYDGEYRGVYLLCEKTEVGTGRVDIPNLEAAIEKANPDIEDFDKLQTVTGTTSFGTPCQYVAGIELPEDYSAGYLLEFDYENRSRAEKSWFATEDGLSKSRFVTVKSPEYLPQEALEYIAGRWQQAERALYNGGTDPVTGVAWDDLIDAESLARVYLIEELSQDIDAFLSSCYFYLPEGAEKFCAGPVWDFDVAYGENAYSSVACSPEGLGAGQTDFGKALLSIPEFQMAVKAEAAGFSVAVRNGAAVLSDIAMRMVPDTAMNAVLWPQCGTTAQAQADLKSFALERAAYLRRTVSAWDGSPVVCTEFFDVFPKQWSRDDVVYAVENGIFTGVSPGYFFPGSAMTRAMTVTVLYRMAGSPAVTAPASFSDVRPGIWYADAVAWAVSSGVTNGTGNGTFSPDSFVTRQDFAVMLHRCAGSPDAEGALEFGDEDSIAPYAKKALRWAVSESLLNGDKRGYLLPAGNLTREQAAAILHRMAE